MSTQQKLHRIIFHELNFKTKDNLEDEIERLKDILFFLFQTHLTVFNSIRTSSSEQKISAISKPNERKVKNLRQKLQDEIDYNIKGNLEEEIERRKNLLGFFIRAQDNINHSLKRLLNTEKLCYMIKQKDSIAEQIFTYVTPGQNLLKLTDKCLDKIF